MAEKIKSGPVSHSSGIKQPGNQSTIKGPTYPESAHLPWNKSEGKGGTKK